MENPALADIRRGDAHQLLFANAAPLLHNPVGLPQLDAVDGVAHAAGIGKMTAASSAAQDTRKSLPRFGIERIVLLCEHQFGDRDQLFHRSNPGS